jgi:hypothetical protein
MPLEPHLQVSPLSLFSALNFIHFCFSFYYFHSTYFEFGFHFLFQFPKVETLIIDFGYFSFSKICISLKSVNFEWFVLLFSFEIF